MSGGSRTQLYSPLVGETNWMETRALRFNMLKNISVLSPLVGETNWMETKTVHANIKPNIEAPHSLGKLIEWKLQLEFHQTWSG